MDGARFRMRVGVDERGTTEYTSIDSPPPGKISRLQKIVGTLCVATLAATALFEYSGIVQTSAFGMILKAKASVPHTGEYCLGSGAKTYTKTTLKRIVDRPIAGLLTYEASAGESKFEASDVIRLGEQFFAVCDSSWSILKLSEDLPLLSHANRLIHHDDSFTPPDDEDSGFEAIMVSLALLAHIPCGLSPCSCASALDLRSRSTTALPKAVALRAVTFMSFGSPWGT